MSLLLVFSTILLICGKSIDNSELANGSHSFGYYLCDDLYTDSTTNLWISSFMEINTETIHIDSSKDDEIIYNDEKQQEKDTSDDYGYSSSNSDDSYDNNNDDNKQEGDVNNFDINTVNWNSFRNDIGNKNIMPNIEYLSQFGVFFNDYKFNQTQINNNKKYIPNKNNFFNISYANANINTIADVIFKYNINKEIFNKIYFDKCKNRKLNLMIVLHHSMKTKYRYKEDLKSKLQAISDIILNIFTNILSDSDRFGLITF